MLIPDNIIDSLPKGIYIKYCELNDDSKKQVLEYTALKIKEEQNNNKVTKLSLKERVRASVVPHINYLHNKQTIKDLVDKEVAEQIVNDNSNKDYLKPITKEEAEKLIEKAEQYVKENRTKNIDVKEIETNIKNVSEEIDKIANSVNKNLDKIVNETEDIINKPNHYHKGGFDIYEIMQAKLSKEKYKGFCEGNILKYLLRAELKGKPLEDLKKLRFNVDRTIEAYEGIEYVPEYKKPKTKDTSQNEAIIYALEHLRAIDEYLHLLRNDDELDGNVYDRLHMLSNDAIEALKEVVRHDD